jgi:nuclear GTP-binding protein
LGEWAQKHMKKNHRHKHMILLMNKCDLVPAWVTKRWLHTLSREYPTLAFHASQTGAFGKGALLSVLRQLARLKGDKSGISVGFVGYPNVGKSSVINTLRAKKVCKTAPVPGETKIWQYITLTKKINLIDCPGVVYYRNSDTDSSVVLKGVTRVGNLIDATEHIADVLARVKPQYLTRAYKLKTWDGVDDFLEQVARICGKLGKGGEPDVNTAAKMVLLDWQRGKIPYFEMPPELPPKLQIGALEKVCVNMTVRPCPPLPSRLRLRSSSSARSLTGRLSSSDSVAVLRCAGIHEQPPAHRPQRAVGRIHRVQFWSQRR